MMYRFNYKFFKDSQKTLEIALSTEQVAHIFRLAGTNLTRLKEDHASMITPKELKLLDVCNTLGYNMENAE